MTRVRFVFLCFSMSSYDHFLDQDPEEEKAERKRLTEEYKPLLEWMKKEANGIVQDGGSQVAP